LNVYLFFKYVLTYVDLIVSIFISYIQPFNKLGKRLQFTEKKKEEKLCYNVLDLLDELKKNILKTFLI